MRQPRLGRNIGIAIAGIGLAAFVLALAISRASKPGNFEVLLGVIGLKTAIVASAIALISHFRVVRRYDRLMRGEGVLARWRIDPARWQVFREACGRIAKDAKALPNDARVADEIPAEGIEVVISDNAALLGRDFHVLQKTALVRVLEPIIEFEQIEPVSRFSTRRAAYRLPMPENATDEAKRIAHRYATDGAARIRSVRKAAVVALVVAVLALVAIIVKLITVANR